MKYYVLDDYREKETKKLNKKKLVKTIAIVISTVAVIVLFSVYVGSAEFRGWVDCYILRKEITENAGNIIQISQDDNPYIYAYDKYITVLKKNSLEYYNSNGNMEFSISVNISNPLFETNGKYLVLAEREGKKIYLISGQNIIWQKDLEGNIANVNVNKNGYISVIITGTTHKTLVNTYDSNGNPVITVFLSSTYAIDTDISSDNKNLAIAEINSNGNVIQSSIKVYSLEIAKTDPSNAEIYRYEGNAKEIINCIKYQNGNNLACMLDDRIILIKDNNIQNTYDFEANATFADINLSGYFLKVIKESTGIFSTESNVAIYNINNETRVKKLIEELSIMKK